MSGHFSAKRPCQSSSKKFFPPAPGGGTLQETTFCFNFPYSGRHFLSFPPPRFQLERLRRLKTPIFLNQPIGSLDDHRHRTPGLSPISLGSINRSRRFSSSQYPLFQENLESFFYTGHKPVCQVG